MTTLQEVVDGVREAQEVVRNLLNTRVLGVRIKQARCTCFATQMSPNAVWSRRLRNMQGSWC